MIHDIAITEKNVIINDLPMQFKPENVALGKPAFKFNKNMSAKYGVMDRHCKDASEIKWFDLPNHYVFHYINSWDSVNEKGEDVVTLFGCTLDDIKLEFKHKDNALDPFEQEHPFLWEAQDSESRQKLTKFTFNLTTGESDMKVLLEDLSSDFPMIDQDQMGYKNRYAYLTYFSDEIPDDKNGVYSQFFEGVYKYDL